MNIQWDADGYAGDFGFVPQYGLDVMSLLEVEPGMHVVDMGCGTGVLTNAMAQAGLEVEGVDASSEMLAVAQANYPAIEFTCADACSFVPDEPVDAVFSNAVFHWIEDHDDLCSSIERALKPGGQLVFECGGYGCTQRIHAALEYAFGQRGLAYDHRFNFSTIAEFSEKLESHGMLPKTALLFDRPTPLEGDDGMLGWMRMFVKVPFRAVGIDPDGEQADEIRREAVELLRPVLCPQGKWVADYVRLRMRAIKKTQEADLLRTAYSM